jgi:hypothetical protein
VVVDVAATPRRVVKTSAPRIASTRLCPDGEKVKASNSRRQPPSTLEPNPAPIHANCQDLDRITEAYGDFFGLNRARVRRQVVLFTQALAAK